VWCSKRSIEYSIYSNVVVSSAAAMLCAGFTYNLGQNNFVLYGFLAFFATGTAYSFQRLYKAENAFTISPALAWARKHKKQQSIAIIISGIFTVFLLVFLVQKIIMVSLLLLLVGAISIVYVVPLFGKSLRDVPFLKSPIVAFVWTVFLVVFPTLNEGISLHDNFGQVMAYFFFFIAVTIPFDLRDVDIDDPHQKTLPMVIGVFYSKVIATVLILGSSLFFALFNENLSFNWFFYVVIGVLLVLILFTTPHRSIVFFAALDATLALLGLAYFV